MNDAQASVTAGFTLVAASLAVQQHWISRLAAWSGSPITKTMAQPVPHGNLSNWQAALIAYVILLLIAESDSFGTMASAIAWGIGLVELFAAIPELQKEFPSLFSTGGAGTPGGASSPTQVRQTQ